MVTEAAGSADAYEHDFLDWTRQQADLLRRASEIRPNTIPGLDWEHLAEEVEDLGKALTRELGSRYKVLLIHLLKWQFQPNLQGPSWRRTIADQRDEIADLIRRNPSLDRQRADELAMAYPRARRATALETGLPVRTFPEANPFGLDQVEDDTFWPQADLGL